MADISRRFSPYAYGNNNPLRFIDPSGMTSEEVKDFSYSDGYSTLSARNSTGGIGLSGAYQNNDFEDDKPKNKKGDKNDTPNTTAKEQTKEDPNKQANCPQCLDPSTIGKNLFGLSYPGGNNPRSYDRSYNYSYAPLEPSEYPAIGHDRRYDNLEIEGASGLFTDTRAIGADYKFVAEEISLASLPLMPPGWRIRSTILGVGLGLAALPKTILKLSSPTAIMDIVLWYKVSSTGVSNKPSKP